MSEAISLHAIVTPELAGSRLDQAAAQLFPAYSRERLKQWIQEGTLTLDGQQAKPKEKVMGGETLNVAVILEDETIALAENIPLDIIHEDDQLIVLNKPAGLVVHPGAGNSQGTLMNALLHHEPLLSQLPRAGIVHRLDRDTTGLMVVAKTLTAHTSLVAQLSDKRVYREYEAVSYGNMTAGGTVEAPIDRHPHDRVKMAVVPGGRPAVTHYRILQRFPNHTHVRVQLETGRTHQIRVHLAHIGYPLVGDPVYARLRFPKGASAELNEKLKTFTRQALHARRLGLVHPGTGESCLWECELPADFVSLLDAIKADAQPATL
ncbi:23S rRNA pseudouridine(1911/1915/1917) synthase RluD [Perlucidibaca aquatica]|uniref:23S rRNA pseudouridine(1911/1915/1917) synthase RluD n=1 Tax=Perlucidibaca aquatica TaxID=1852776 RepID=UPI00083A6D83|nr:23S rRNA pseudouridine(1911/1915/1917) synthase RluD [Perlucidibaca aquatica]